MLLLNVRTTRASPLQSCSQTLKLGGGFWPDLTLGVVVDDLRRNVPQERILLHTPETPVMSDIDPDAVGILCRRS